MTELSEETARRLAEAIERLTEVMERAHDDDERALSVQVRPPLPKYQRERKVLPKDRRRRAGPPAPSP